MERLIYTDTKVLDHLTAVTQIISSTVDNDLWYTILSDYLFSEVNFKYYTLK